MNRGLGVLLAMALMVVAGVSAYAQNPPKTKVAHLEVRGSLPERPGDFDWLGGRTTTLRSVVRTLRDVARRDDVSAVVVRLKDAQLTTTQIEEIGAALEACRAAGRPVYLFGEWLGPAELLLGASADRVLVQAGGTVSFPGLYLEEMYLADTLAWVGIQADLLQIGDYKGAAEPFTRSAPSEAWEANINGLLDGLYANVRSRIMRGRHLTDVQLDEAMRRVWLADASEAIAAGLVDQSVDLPDLARAVSGREEPQWEKLDTALRPRQRPDASNPLAAFTAMMKALTEKPRHKPSRPAIAVVHVTGAIVDGDSSAGGLFGGEITGSRTIRNALEDVLDEDLIRGVVVRIDSPGGSAMASEIIWRGLRRVAERKPVWVSVGSMAASGGYYVAVAGDRIYVNPSSIVGSIGVVGGKLVLGGLYDKARLRVVERGRGPMADLFASTQSWSDAQRAAVHQKMQRIYDLFAARVAAGRPRADLQHVGEGRLFTGTQAVHNGLADALGGLDAAVADLARELGLDDPEVLDYPGPRSLEELLEDIFGGTMALGPGHGSGMTDGLGVRVEATVMAEIVRRLLGEQAWRQVRTSLEALMQLRREPVVLVLPRALIVR